MAAAGPVCGAGLEQFDHPAVGVGEQDLASARAGDRIAAERHLSHRGHPLRWTACLRRTARSGPDVPAGWDV